MASLHLIPLGALRGYQNIRDLCVCVCATDLSGSPFFLHLPEKNKKKTKYSATWVQMCPGPHFHEGVSFWCLRPGAWGFTSTALQPAPSAPATSRWRWERGWGWLLFSLAAPSFPLEPAPIFLIPPLPLEPARDAGKETPGFTPTVRTKHKLSVSDKARGGVSDRK